jgi:transcriptional regulator EpsA
VEQAVILSNLEREYLLRAIEPAVNVRELSQFFLWSQGQLQALLPHQTMLCLHLDSDDSVRHIVCLHGAPLEQKAQAYLADAELGLVVRIARHCRGQRLPLMLDATEQFPAPALGPFQAELRAHGIGNLLVHGSERLAGGSTFFLMLDMPHKPGPRQAYFIELILPYLHLGLMHVSAGARPVMTADGQAAKGLVSARELEVLNWVGQGKSNDEIGEILAISGLTVKNHLGRIFRRLGVSNRAQALAHCIALGVLPAPGLASRSKKQ